MSGPLMSIKDHLEIQRKKDLENPFMKELIEKGYFTKNCQANFESFEEFNELPSEKKKECYELIENYLSSSWYD